LAVPLDGIGRSLGEWGYSVILMRPADVLAVLDLLEDRGLAAWVDGGWGVDALLGRQTREHADLDLVIARADCDAAEAALVSLGFARDTGAEPGLPARLALRADDGRRLDLHLVIFDGNGDAWQELPGGGWGAYPADGLAGVGSIDGHHVRCVSARLQLRHHLGYPLDDRDRHDLRLLAERFRLGLPPGL
jgi:lincosamide nucleotidyltransferase A/C/D/E